MDFNGSQLTCQVISSELHGFQWPEVSQKSKSSSESLLQNFKKYQDEQFHRGHRVQCLPYNIINQFVSNQMIIPCQFLMEAQPQCNFDQFDLLLL